jgi:hypothetical protein
MDDDADHDAEQGESTPASTSQRKIAERAPQAAWDDLAHS